MPRIHVVVNALTKETHEIPFTPQEEAAADLAFANLPVPEEKRDPLAELDALKAVLVAKGQITEIEAAVVAVADVVEVLK